MDNKRCCLWSCSCIRARILTHVFQFIIFKFPQKFGHPDFHLWTIPVNWVVLGTMMGCLGLGGLPYFCLPATHHLKHQAHLPHFPPQWTPVHVKARVHMCTQPHIHTYTQAWDEAAGSQIKTFPSPFGSPWLHQNEAASLTTCFSMWETYFQTSTLHSA